MLLRSQLYTGIVDVPEYGVRAKRGDFEPLISEHLFYRVLAVLPVACRARRATPGINGVPAFVADRRAARTGLQPVEGLMELVQHVKSLHPGL